MPNVLTLLRLSPWLAILLLLGWTIHLNDLKGKWETNAHHCASARHADRESYAKAQADAQAKNDAQLVRVKSEQQGISDNAKRSFDADLARLRAELAKRLPQGRTAAPQGTPIGPGASPLPRAPGGPDAEARVCIPTSLYVRGAENELQLDSLIGWLERQMKIDPNKP